LKKLLPNSSQEFLNMGLNPQSNSREDSHWILWKLDPAEWDKYYL